MKRWIFFLPLLGFLGLGAYLWDGLYLNPHRVPTVLKGQEVPPFDLPPLEGRDAIGFSNAGLKGEVSLVNVFGSWCVACREEHPFLLVIKKNGWVPIHGIDWREPDRTSGPEYLARHGDPYTLVGDDPHSEAAIAFGVTGAPETFLVDAKGVIRYKQIGPITPEVWKETLEPLIKQLREEGK